MSGKRRSRPAANTAPALVGVTRVLGGLPAIGGRRAESFGIVRDLVSAFRRNRLGTHSTALAFRVIVSLVPLVLLGMALLGALGQESYWTDSISPTLHRHFTEPVAVAVDDVAYRIFATSSVGLLVLASVLLVWNTLRGIRSVEHALDEIHEQVRPRGSVQAFLVGVPLAVAVDLSILGALFVFVAAPRIAGSGLGHEAVVVLRWAGAVLLLWIAVALLIRYAPAEKPEVSWASGGSAVVVGGWLVSSALFGLWSADVANYKSATGTLIAFLVLTAYTLVVAYVFVLGAQFDESLRQRQQEPRSRRTERA